MPEPERFIFIGGHAINPKAIAAITPTDGTGGCSILLTSGEHLSIKQPQAAVLNLWFKALTGHDLHEERTRDFVTTETRVVKEQCR
jgi:hypothetical protein